MAAARRAFTEHPMFETANMHANAALANAARQMDCEQELPHFEAHATRVVNEMTKLLLRAHDRRTAGV